MPTDYTSKCHIFYDTTTEFPPPGDVRRGHSREFPPPTRREDRPPGRTLCRQNGETGGGEGVRI